MTPVDDETRWKMGHHRWEKRTEEMEGRKTGTAVIGREVGAHLTVSEARTAWSALATERGTRHTAMEAMGQSVGSEQGK